MIQLPNFSGFIKICSNKIHIKIFITLLHFLGISLLVFAISDRITTTTVFWRVLILSTGVVSALWAVFKLITYFYFHTRKLTWLAKCVRKVYRAKGKDYSVLSRLLKKKTGTTSFRRKFLKQLSTK